MHSEFPLRDKAGETYNEKELTFIQPNSVKIDLEKLTSQLVTDCWYITTATTNTTTDNRKKTAGLSSRRFRCTYSFLIACEHVALGVCVRQSKIRGQ